MAESSLRAARSERRGGVPNVLFLVAAAEHPPPELCDLADELTVLFPWGSLLRGALCLDEVAAAGLAGLVRPGGRVEIFVSITGRDGLGIPPLRLEEGPAIARRWANLGLELAAFESADLAETSAIGSSWAMRLRAGHDRPAWRLAFVRTSAREQGD
jgi:16S rRNA (adenine(1408)-N(1))-methyltransferase